MVGGGVEMTGREGGGTERRSENEGVNQREH